MDQVNSSGITGSKAKFTIDLPQHNLSFTTKLQVTEANLPSEASIELPKVHVSAEYVQDGSNNLNDSKLAGMLRILYIVFLFYFNFIQSIHVYCCVF